jgi:hypothetical protein
MRTEKKLLQVPLLHERRILTSVIDSGGRQVLGCKRVMIYILGLVINSGSTSNTERIRYLAHYIRIRASSLRLDLTKNGVHCLVDHVPGAEISKDTGAAIFNFCGRKITCHVL